MGEVLAGILLLSYSSTRNPALEVAPTTLATWIFAWLLLLCSFQLSSAFQPRSAISAVPESPTYDNDLRMSPRQRRREPACQISRSKVKFKSYCPDTQICTSLADFSTWTTKLVGNEWEL